MADLVQFCAFYFNNLTLCILFKFVLHVTTKQFSDKFDNGWKKIQNGRFIVIFCILRQLFDLVSTR